MKITVNRCVFQTDIEHGFVYSSNDWTRLEFNDCVFSQALASALGTRNRWSATTATYPLPHLNTQLCPRHSFVPFPTATAPQTPTSTSVPTPTPVFDPTIILKLSYTFSNSKPFPTATGSQTPTSTQAPTPTFVFDPTIVLKSSKIFSNSKPFQTAAASQTPTASAIFTAAPIPPRTVRWVTAGLLFHFVYW
jgi:hypothetical protein